MKKISLIYVFLAGIIFYQPVCFSSDAFVSADGSFGQGYFRTRGNECLFITPAHVVEDAGEITLITDSRKEISADILNIFPGDIALLKVNLKGKETCPKSSWSNGNKLSAFLKIYGDGYIITRLEDGSSLRTEVKIQGYDKFSTIKITSLNPKVDISKGFSGSPLFVADRPAGMLLSVKNGIGKVTRQDALNSYLSLFFNAQDDANESSNVQPISAPTPKHSHPPEVVNTTHVEKKSTPKKISQAVDGIKIGSSLTGSIAKGNKIRKKIYLEKNSPITLSTPINRWGQYQVYITDDIDEDAKAIWKFYTDQGRPRSYGFTPPKTGIYYINIYGKSGHGEYSVKVKSLSTNAVLTSKANVATAGDKLTGKIAEKAMARYSIQLEKNSPISLKLGSARWGSYKLYITDDLDEDTKPLLSFNSYETPVTKGFTPLKTGIFYINLYGRKGFGDYSVKVKSITTNKILTSKSNIITPGDKVTGKIAEKAMARYSIQLEKNSPISLKLGSARWGSYKLYITDDLDEDTKPLLSFNSYETPVTKGFTPLKTGIFYINLYGRKGFGDYSVKVKALSSNTVLTGKANIARLGDKLTGIVAEKSRARYSIQLNKNTPLTVNLNSTRWGSYNINITDNLDGDTKPLLSFNSYDSPISKGFTPPKTSIYYINIYGKRGYGEYSVKIKSLKK